jgi:hypothetical protein
MISGKIILKSATKLSLDQRFGEIAKQAPPPARIQQQTNVIIPQSRQDLFGNKRSATLSAANRLKKRSINYRFGFGNNAAPNRQYPTPRTPRVFQRLSFGNRRRGGGANSYLFGGQSGMGIRLRGQGRIGTRIFRSQTRGYLNNNTISRVSGYSRRGNNNNNYNNRGRRFQNRPNRGRGGNKNFNRGRGNGRNNNRRNNNNPNFTKETLDNELEKYMAQTKLDNDSVDMNTI